MDNKQFKKICNQFVNLTKNCVNNSGVERTTVKSNNDLKTSTNKEYEDLSKLITVRYLPFKRHRKQAKISFKEVIIQTSSGVIAGVVEIVICQPLDVIKTRFQIQSSITKVHYDGFIDCFKKMYKTEGLTSFYKGIIPPLIIETPRRALLFVSFEQYKAQLSQYFTDSPNMVCFMAGAASGATDAAVANIPEVVKVLLQTEVGNSKPKINDLLKQIKNEGGYGLSGLNKGLDATMFRNSGYGFAYFGVYYSYMSGTSKFSDPTKEFFRKLFAGTLAGAIATCLVTPFDVIKSRIQSSPPNVLQVKYKYLFPSLRDVYKEFGWRALYQGFIPKILRLGPGGAILMVVYEGVNTKLHEIHY